MYGFNTYIHIQFMYPQYNIVYEIRLKLFEFIFWEISNALPDRVSIENRTISASCLVVNKTFFSNWIFLFVCIIYYSWVDIVTFRKIDIQTNLAPSSSKYINKYLDYFMIITWIFLLEMSCSIAGVLLSLLIWDTLYICIIKTIE